MKLRLGRAEAPGCPRCVMRGTGATSAAFEDALFLLFQGCPALHLSFLKSKHFLVHYKRNACP